MTITPQETAALHGALRAGNPELYGSSYVAVESVETAGSAVWWRLSGGLNLAALEAAWVEAGLDPELLPRAPSPQTALARAAKTQAGPRMLVRSLDGGKGWAIVAEKAQGEDLDYAVEARLGLNAAGQLVVKPVDHKRADELAASYRRHLTDLIQADVSPWLTKLMGTVHAVSLRDTGGVYFVPRTHLDMWRAMVAAIRKASSHAVLGMPCMRTDEAIEAITDAIAQEARAEAEALEEELAKAQSGDADAPKLGSRALEGRLTKADRVKAKVASYEALLGQKLDALHERLDEVKAKLARARLTVEAGNGTSLGQGRLEVDLG
jgi:hypothetical protein